MDLFKTDLDEHANVLPRDGLVRYFGAVMPESDADRYLATLLSNVAWRHDEYHFAGKHVITARQIAWYGDTAATNAERPVLEWLPELRDLKAIVEDRAGQTFQRCLLNLYHDGEQGLGWHSDGEMTPVASLSLGAPRRFVFKHKQDGEKVELTLGHGDLLVMEGDTQKFWQHRVPPMKRVRSSRVNLTFRQSR